MYILIVGAGLAAAGACVRLMRGGESVQADRFTRTPLTLDGMWSVCHLLFLVGRDRQQGCGWAEQSCKRRGSPDLSSRKGERGKATGWIRLLNKMPWIQDVKVHTNALLAEQEGTTTTGGELWPACGRLVQYLSEMDVIPSDSGKKVLELGAGVGALGLTICRNTGARVCMTEQEAGVAWLQHNVTENQGLPHVKSKCSALQCDWRDFPAAAPPPMQGHAQSSNDGKCIEPHTPAQQQTHVCQQGEGAQQPECLNQQQGDTEQQHSHINQQGEGCQQEVCRSRGKDADYAYLISQSWDVIVGSDLVYNQIGSTLLPRVLRRLSAPSTVIVYSHTKHRFDHLDIQFFEELDANGFRVKEVQEPRLPPRPASPPPLTDLFPEQRIAIYQISLKPEMLS